MFELLERREIHLTTIALICKHLTPENHLELLREARGKTKRELLEFLARRFPKATEPNQLRALPLPAGSFAAGPTGALEPFSEHVYRLHLNIDAETLGELELARDLMSHANPSGDLSVVLKRALKALVAELKKQRFGQVSRPRRSARRTAAPPSSAESISEAAGSPITARSSANATQRGEADSESAAKSLGGVQRSGPNLGQPKSETCAPGRGEAGVGAGELKLEVGETRLGAGEPKLEVGEARLGAEEPRSDADQARPGAGELKPDEDLNLERRTGAGQKGRRRIASEVRRELLARDGLRCTFVSGDGHRCRARAFVQIHHEQAWAKGGADTFENLRLLCAGHNRMLGECEFGAVRLERAG